MLDYFSSPNATPNPLAPTRRGLSVMSGEIWRHGAYATLRQSQPELLQGRRRGRSQGCLFSPGSGQDPPSSHVAPCPGLVHKALYMPGKWRSPENAVDIVHNSSHTGRCRRTTGPLLLRRDPRPAFPGRKAGMRTAFQCVFGEKNK